MRSTIANGSAAFRYRPVFPSLRYGFESIPVVQRPAQSTGADSDVSTAIVDSMLWQTVTITVIHFIKNRSRMITERGNALTREDEWRTPSRFSADDKIALFRRLFRGRTDVYPVRWESPSTGKAGYVPACANEWRAGICDKRRIKCSDCGNRLLIPLSDAVIYDHLAGKYTVGVYPLLTNGTCHFLAVDFDEAEWRQDALFFVQSGHELGVPVALEISRSGKDAHAWVFFAGTVSARDAPRLGTAIISHTCARTRQLTLTSDDRLFPNQDTMPKGGLGNLIALPLQKQPRENGWSVFVDEDFRPHPDQWAFLDFEKTQLPQPLANRLIRLAAFQNPELYKAQAMRFAVWDKPRVIGCAESYPNHIALPRGCLDAAQAL
ncbi:DNA primase small subunit domain-containing protein, partial [uncultured Thiodictyon sp.]